MRKFTLFPLRRFTCLLLSALLLLSAASGCRQRDDAPVEKTVLTVMCWNDDFRNAMETYFIPRHPALMANVEIRWINDEIVGYRDNVERRLLAGESIDLFLADDEMTPFFANHAGTASLAQLGIEESDLSNQFRYTRTLATDAGGVQRGSAMSAEPGILLYRADYAATYLGITDPDEMRQKLSSWEGVYETAVALRERSGGDVKMFSDSSEPWRSVDAVMTGHWLTDGKLSVTDETLAHWLDTVKSLNAAKGLAGIKPFDDDWGNAVDGSVFCFCTAPWLNKNVASDNADITTLYAVAKRGGTSFGKFRTAPAPSGFVYGGTWLFSSANSTHHELVGEIVHAFTCDAEFMRLLALGNMSYVNHIDVNRELGELNIANPLFDGENAFSVYTNAAASLDLSQPSLYDKRLSRLLFTQAKSYAQGKVSREKAISNFRAAVSKNYSEIVPEPDPEETTPAQP